MPSCCRVRHSRFSLPIEDETRHVVDAQLLNEDVAVMAYDRGQTQISCISLVKVRIPFVPQDRND